MYCEGCGGRLSEGAKFCRFCGKQVGGAATARDDRAIRDALSSGQRGQRSGWQPVNVALGLVILATVLAVIASGFYLFPLYPLYFGPAVVSGLILMFTKRNGFVVASILLLLGLAYSFVPIFPGPCLLVRPTSLLGPEFETLDVGSRTLLVGVICAKVLSLVAGLFVLASAAFVKVTRRPLAIPSLLAALIAVAIVLLALPAPAGVGGEQPRIAVVEAMDGQTRVVLSSAFPPTEQALKSSFAAGEAVYPQEEGLPKGARYAFRVVDAKGTEVIPVERWGVAEAKVGVGMEGSGVCNTQESPLAPGSYRVQLVKIESDKGFVLAQTDLTIAGDVDQEARIASGLQVWLTTENDASSKRYQTVTMEGGSPTDVFVWVKGPAGKVITGVVQLLAPDGSVRFQFEFKTDPGGQPVKALHSGGDPLPSGEYPIKVLVEGSVVAEASIVSK